MTRSAVMQSAVRLVLLLCIAAIVQPIKTKTAKEWTLGERRRSLIASLRAAARTDVVAAKLYCTGKTSRGVSRPGYLSSAVITVNLTTPALRPTHRSKPSGNGTLADVAHGSLTMSIPPQVARQCALNPEIRCCGNTCRSFVEFFQ